MPIAFISCPGDRPGVGPCETLRIRALRELYEGHSLFPVFRPFSEPEDWKQLATAEAILTFGSVPELAGHSLSVKCVDTVHDPLLLLKPARTLTRELDRLAFSPGGLFSREVLYRLERPAEILFLAEKAKDLSSGAIPGISTLYTPKFPELLREALKACCGLVSFRMDYVCAALSQGTPAVLLCSDPASRRIARGLGVPCREVTSRRDATAAAQWAREQLACYPWPEVENQVRQARERMLRQLSKIEIPAISVPEKATATLTSERLPICSVADHRYLPFLFGFLENLMGLGFELQNFHLLALDETVREAVSARFSKASLSIYTPEDLWTPSELKIVEKRGPGSKAFASKPRLLQHVLQKLQGPVLYSDLDIYFFESPDSLEAYFRNDQVLLFPQWNDQLWHSKFYGVFNAGMLGVRPGAESFLKWWSERCLRDYNANFLQGYYADQGFLDLVPAYFSGIRIYREGDHNIAYWNTRTLVQKFDPLEEPTPQLRTGAPIRSFHAAVPDDLGIYEWKFGWDQLVAFFSLFKNPADKELIQEEATLQQSKYWLDLARLRKAKQLLRIKLVDWSPWNPTFARFLLHSYGRYFIRGASRTHYYCLRSVRACGRFLVGLPQRNAAANRSHLTLNRPPSPLDSAWGESS